VRVDLTRVGGEVLEAGDRSHVEGRALGVVVDTLVDRRLEAALVDHQVGLGQVDGLGEGQLDVVRLQARAGEVRDERAGRDLPAHPGQRVEAGRDRDLARLRLVGTRCTARQQGGYQGDGEQDGLHENHSQ